MKGWLKSLVRRVGYDIVRSDGSGTMASAIARLASTTDVRSVIDVGASDGRWSAMVRERYPRARYLLVEAQAEPHREGLQRFASQSPRIEFVLAAAGNVVGETHFDASDPFSGVASRVPTGAHDLVVPMTTIDHEVASRGLEPPFLLKLDTHGFEGPILEGAAETLQQTAIAVIEAYNFELQPGAMRFHELCAFLEERGMRSMDVVDIMRRPQDGFLWQFDLVFTRADRPEFDSNTYA